MHWIFGKSNFMLWIVYTGKNIKVNIDKKFSDPGNLTCVVPQGSILDPLLFLLYVYDMPQAVKCDSFLYADDACLTFQHENVKEIEDQLNLNFSRLCDWFIDNKLSIHLGEDKTKSILFGTKLNIKRAEPLNIVYGNVKIKHFWLICQGNRWRSMFLIKSTLDSDFSN